MNATRVAGAATTVRPARALVVLVGVVLVGAVAALGGCAPDATDPGRAAGGAPAGSVRVLQLNLCGSGIARCYTGRSTAEAAAVIRAERPDLVTLNEVCQDDVPVLEQALGEAVPGAAVTSAFRAALDRRTGQPWRCRDGREYGIGLVARWAPAPGSTPTGGTYPDQAGDDPEDRVFLCADLAADPPVAGCTTHLAYTDRAVAAAQCRYLLGTVLGRRPAGDRVVLGGDLNLGPGGSPGLRSCLPAGSALADDGGQQHVVAWPGYSVAGSRTVDLRGSTDHPGLLVTLAPAAGG